jgi:hypothetical protein
MKINFAKELMMIDGKTKMPAADGNIATVKGAVIDALLATYNDEQNLAGAEKLKRYKLAMRISNDETEFESEEVTLFKTLTGKAYGPIVVGQVWDTLEGK